MSPNDILQTFGYASVDRNTSQTRRATESNKLSLNVSMSTAGWNAQDLGLRVIQVTDEIPTQLGLGDAAEPPDSRELQVLWRDDVRTHKVCGWWMSTVLEHTQEKMGTALVGLADTSTDNGETHYDFTRFIFLDELDADRIVDSIKRAELRIEFRMHLRTTGRVRNHGTVFRIPLGDLTSWYRIHEEV